MGFRAGLTPDQFWSLTIAELLLAIEANGERYREDMEKLAWQTAYLLQPWSKRKVKPSQLLPWSKGEVKFTKDDNPEKIREVMQRRREMKRRAKEK